MKRERDKKRRKKWKEKGRGGEYCKGERKIHIRKV